MDELSYDFTESICIRLSVAKYSMDEGREDKNRELGTGMREEGRQEQGTGNRDEGEKTGNWEQG